MTRNRKCLRFRYLLWIIHIVENAPKLNISSQWKQRNLNKLSQANASEWHRECVCVDSFWQQFLLFHFIYFLRNNARRCHTMPCYEMRCERIHFMCECRSLHIYALCFWFLCFWLLVDSLHVKESCTTNVSQQKKTICSNKNENTKMSMYVRAFAPYT